MDNRSYFSKSGRNMKIYKEITDARKRREYDSNASYDITGSSTDVVANLKEAYDEWVSSSYIICEPSVADVRCEPKSMNDFLMKNLNASTPYIYINNGSHCFCCFPDYILLFDNNGFFIDAYNKDVISVGTGIKVMQKEEEEHPVFEYKEVGSTDNRPGFVDVEYAVLNLRIAGFKMRYYVIGHEKNTLFALALKQYSES